MSVNKEYSLC